MAVNLTAFYSIYCLLCSSVGGVEKFCFSTVLFDISAWPSLDYRDDENGQSSFFLD